MAGGTSDVLKVLRSFGPSLSTKVVTRLVEGGLSLAAAKQRISRSCKANSVERTHGISFPHKESFVYLKDQRDGPEFVTRLWESLVETGSTAAHCIHALHARGGMIPIAHFPTISGCPDHLTKHPGHQRMLEFLLRYNLVATRDIDGIGSCIQLGQGLPFDSAAGPARLKARLLAEDIALKHFTRWLSLMGFISHSSFEVRELHTSPEFGHFNWDMTSPSYSHPFVKKRPGDNPVPGFVVADVSINGQMTLPQVRAFLRKCDIIRHLEKSRPFLSALIADHFAHDAFNWIREQGSLAITMRNLLGEDLAHALKMLLAILTNTAQAASTKPEVIQDVFGKLSAIEGAAANLRGPLFELIVGHCVGQRDGGNVEVQKAIRQPGKSELTDIDVLRLKPNQEVTAYECKGHLGHVLIKEAEVKRWLTETIKKVREYFLEQDQFKNVQHRFEFWTTGTFDAGATALLDEAKKTKKYEVSWKDGAQVLEYVSKTKAGKLDEVLREHFLSHPLPKLDRKNRKAQEQEHSDSAVIPAIFEEASAEDSNATKEEPLPK